MISVGICRNIFVIDLVVKKCTFEIIKRRKIATLKRVVLALFCNKPSRFKVAFRVVKKVLV